MKDFIQVKKKCTTISGFMKVVFGIALLLTVIQIIFAFYILRSDNSAFQIKYFEPPSNEWFILSADNGAILTRIHNDFISGELTNPKMLLFAQIIQIAVRTFSYTLIAFWIMRVFGNFQKGATPFTGKNASYIRRIGWTIISIAFIPRLARNLILLITHIGGYTYFNRISFLPTLIAGITILALGHIFRYGTLLQEEYNSTI